MAPFLLLSVCLGLILCVVQALGDDEHVMQRVATSAGEGETGGFNSVRCFISQARREKWGILMLFIIIICVCEIPYAL